MSRIKVITLTPDALDRNGISLTDTILATRLDFLLNGALATGYDRDGIGASQTPTSAAAMTLDGARGTDFRAQGGVHVLLYGAADDTGRTFTVVGTDVNNYPITEAITGPDATLIVLSAARFYTVVSVTPDAATAGAIEIGTNGYINFTQAQHLSTFSSGDESGETLTFVGEDRYGNALTETDVGPTAAATVTALKNFKKLYKASIGTSSTGAIELGVNGTCESQWFQLNYRGQNFNTGFSVDFAPAGVMTYTVQHTMDDLQAVGFTEDGATAYNHSVVAAKTAALDGVYATPVNAIRLQITAHTSGVANLRVTQTSGW